MKGMSILQAERVVLGSQLFINKEDTPDAVKAWVRQMNEHGLKVIRLFMVWEQLEPTPGGWHFDNYDACFEAAEQYGMRVVPTLMSVSPPGWMKLTPSMQAIADLDDAEFREFAHGYIQKVVIRYRAHPALDSWILWNEPSRTIAKTKHARRAFSQYAREQFKDIAAYNAYTYVKYDSFDQLEAVIDEEVAPGQLPFKSFAEQMIWTRFSVHNLSRHLKDIAEQIRFQDTKHLIHVNPHNLQMDMQSSGQSIWKEAEVVDFLGCSGHPMWHSLRFPEERYGQSIAFFADLMKSATRHPQGLFWVTELQGGTTLYSSHRGFTPSRDRIKQWIWEGIGCGAQAVVFWCFNSRNSGYEAGEWSLLSARGEPSDRLLAVREVSKTLEQYGSLFAEASPEEPFAIILYSEASLALGEAEGEGMDPQNARNKNMYMDALTGAYMLLSDLSIPVVFRNEERFVGEDIPASIQLIVLADTVVLGEGELQQLQLFAEGGGWVIADGLTGWKDGYGMLDRQVQEGAGALFGSDVADIEMIHAKGKIESPYGPIKSWFYQLPLVLEGAECAGTFDNGQTAISRREWGNGGFIRIGTRLFQSYFVDPEGAEGARSFIEAVTRGLTLRSQTNSEQERSSVRTKRLVHPRGDILFLTNDGEPGIARVRTEYACRLLHLTDDTPLAMLNSDVEYCFELGKEGAAVLFLERLIKEEPVHASSF